MCMCVCLCVSKELRGKSPREEENTPTDSTDLLTLLTIQRCPAARPARGKDAGVYADANDEAFCLPADLRAARIVGRGIPLRVKA